MGRLPPVAGLLHPGRPQASQPASQPEHQPISRHRYHPAASSPSVMAGSSSKPACLSCLGRLLGQAAPVAALVGGSKGPGPQRAGRRLHQGLAAGRPEEEEGHEEEKAEETAVVLMIIGMMMRDDRINRDNEGTG